MFSSRVPGDLPSNAITRALESIRLRDVRVIDLTETNPTRVGLPYPDDLLNGLADPGGRTYSPEPLGLASAREAVASSVKVPVDPSRVVLTTSTSEAYAVLFKLLCDAGDEVLVPQPSYPLFEMLTGLEAVSAVPYRLEYHSRWAIDRESVQRALTDRTRAVLVVTPNNPTGSMLRAADRDWLAELCAKRGMAIISDEVFADYPLRPAPDASSFCGETRALTFALGGLSKSAGLPQVKLGWLIVNGPPPLVSQAIDRLELICDTYLSVSTGAQIAARSLIESGSAIRAAILSRVQANLAALTRMVADDSVVSLLLPEGGWSAVLRVPATEPEEALVLRLLNSAHVLVHPGYFFDFHAEAFLVVSLLPETTIFEEGMRRVLNCVEGRS